MNFWTKICLSVALFVALVPLLASHGAANDEELSAKLKGILAVQKDAWNVGDFEKFMEAYWKSEKLTFSSGGKIRRGWKATLENYKKSYPDKATRGTLSFANMEVESLGPDVAMMLGEWKIEGEKPAKGNFSLVWRKIDGKWVIIHDHSSSEEE